MKVLFAVSNEEISDSIVKKYQKEYKQIISYKNVYYFNAILKELQKDKTYDRIVISEDLEAFTHTQYDQIDKFIFEKLDSISDEASNIRGNDTPIILICSDRRTKSEQMLVKFFGIGIYNAIIGNERSVDEVCRLINRPRVKKEAKAYYKIDTEEVNYQAENENDVSEMEIQNIVAHYKRLGKNEDRYIDSFNNIAAQYNDTQLRIITKFLPLNVRAVLEEKSPKYQQIMSFNNSVSDNLRKNKNDKEEGPSQILLKSQNREKILSKPVVIPSAVNMSGNKKLAKHKPINTNHETIPTPEQPKIQPVVKAKEQPPEIPYETKEEPIIEGFDDIIEEPNNIPEPQIMQEETKETVQPVKRGRGRPRKNPVVTSAQNLEQPQPVKRGRGRPRKNPIVNPEIQEEIVEENIILPGIEEQEVEESPLEGFKEIESNTPEEDFSIPGFEEEEIILPGIQASEPEEEEQQQPQPKSENTMQIQPNPEPVIPRQPPRNTITENNNDTNLYHNTTYTNSYSTNMNPNEGTMDLSNLLTPDKKIVTFVGTSKNGTSFIVNNIAELMSSIGINTVILDTTKNRNSYYIYTKNEEPLREIATHSIEGLARGIARGINVNKNLTVYTSLPDENDTIQHVDKILETLLKNHSLILIDTDFDTPFGYFKQSQETYLVQSMDILTIQPLTAFLKELKMRNILDERKLKIVLNKVVKIRGIKNETIIGGMAFYNDPAMSFMTELFDRDRIKYVSIPFEDETYIKYLEGIIECEISLKGYSKIFIQTLRELGNMIYPMITSTPRNNQNYQPPSVQNNKKGNFSSNMDNTLNKMKNKY